MKNQIGPQSDGSVILMRYCPICKHTTKHRMVQKKTLTFTCLAKKHQKENQ